MVAELNQLGRQAAILAEQFRQAGQPHFADMLSVDVQKYAAQASLVTALGGPESFSNPASEAQKSEITPFTSEQITLLTKEGLLADYSTTGKTIANLREEGNLFWSTWHKDYPDFEALASRRSAVAFNPDNPFLPGSNNKTLAEQLEMVAKYNLKLQQKVPGVEAILGQAIDYAELAFAHFKATGRYLFGQEHGYNFTRTQTRVGRNVAHVGPFHPDDGLNVNHWPPVRRPDNIQAAPLVVPIAGNK